MVGVSAQDAPTARRRARRGCTTGPAAPPIVHSRPCTAWCSARAARRVTPALPPCVKMIQTDAI
jgi:hypothetical protein